MTHSTLTTLLLLTLLGCAIACTKRPLVQSDAGTSILCVVRHAEAFKNLDPPPADMTAEELDSLTVDGKRQAHELRKSIPRGVTRVWSSPANRARETAAQLALRPPVVIEPALRQLDGEISWDERTTAWSRGEDGRPDGGESLGDGAERVREMLDRLREELSPGEHAVIVSHGDIVSLILGELRGTPLLDRPTHDRLSTGELSCLPLPSAS